MKKFPYTEIKAQTIEKQSKNLKVRWLITKESGAENFAMRFFEMAVEGHTPHHSHDWEHEVFILEGKGLVVGGKEKKSFKAGEVIFVPANERHQFKNHSKKPVKFLCMIPYKPEQPNKS